MTVSHARLSVNNTTAVPVTDNTDTYSSVTISVQNLGEGVAYLGDAGVSDTSYGFSIVAGGAVTVANLPAKDELYVIHQDNSAYVSVMRVSR